MVRIGLIGDFDECVPAHRAIPAALDMAARSLDMALITDRILKRGWEPDGYEQKDEYRVYRFKDPA